MPATAPPPHAPTTPRETWPGFPQTPWLPPPADLRVRKCARWALERRSAAFGLELRLLCAFPSLVGLEESVRTRESDVPRRRSVRASCWREAATRGCALPTAMRCSSTHPCRANAWASALTVNAWARGCATSSLHGSLGGPSPDAQDDRQQKQQQQQRHAAEKLWDA